MKATVRRKICDPALCRDCVYIGEGDFICERHVDDPDRVLVVEEFEPTENYLQCQLTKRRGNRDIT